VWIVADFENVANLTPPLAPDGLGGHAARHSRCDA
jgi:hypothetical protein